MKKHGMSSKYAPENLGAPSCEAMQNSSERVYWIPNKPFLLLLLACLPHCGQKPRSIIPAEKASCTQAQARQPQKLPTIRSLELTKTSCGNLLRWTPVSPNVCKRTDTECGPAEWHVFGYYIYRFPKEGFVPRTPLARMKATATQFLDKRVAKKQIRTTYSWCYLVRPVFRVEEKIIIGKTSQIVCA